MPDDSYWREERLDGEAGTWTGLGRRPLAASLAASFLEMGDGGSARGTEAYKTAREGNLSREATLTACNVAVKLETKSSASCCVHQE